MIQFLVRKFIPDADNIQDARVRGRYGTLSGALGIFFNLLLFLVKILAGVLSGSISVIADALNNLSDAGSSIVTLIGFRLASHKADAGHPFGHGRIEYLSGLFISIVILLMGFELARESIGKIMHPSLSASSPLVITILLCSILVKLYMYRYNRWLSGKLQSVALESAACDSRNDCITTAVVLLSLILEHVTGLPIDGFGGLAVSIFILVSGIQSLLETSGPLLGQEPDPELVKKITDTVRTTDHVLGMHDLIIHDYGPGTRMMTLHLEVPSDMTLLDSHMLADQLETSLRSKFGIQTVIHVDPVVTDDKEAALLREKLSGFLRYLGPDFLYHDFRVVHEKDRLKVLFDVNCPYNVRMSDDEIQDYLKQEFDKIRPGISLRVGVDHYTRS